jgi:hypothetical protein
MGGRGGQNCRKYEVRTVNSLTIENGTPIEPSIIRRGQSEVELRWCKLLDQSIITIGKIEGFKQVSVQAFGTKGCEPCLELGWRIGRAGVDDDGNLCVVRRSVLEHYK